MKDSTIEEQDKKSLVEELLTEIDQKCEQIFKDQFNELYVSIKINGHYESIRLVSTRFSNIIQGEYYEKTKSILSKDKLSGILSLIVARADLDSLLKIKNLSLRITKDSGKLDSSLHGRDRIEQIYYYDLINSSWQIVRITAEGWEISPNSSTNPLFKRYKNNHPQMMPERNYPSDIVDLLYTCKNLFS
ncbi:MAG: hypothetical protein L0H53_12355 [Candidatus Nitrosocosmicus sp.]|nr:hypothetical protein [Candidatus Nitrosocosmicus sp.]MDN5868321.1 hypothetical protein [Candidatus Nitrosocosmicus sp.]